MKTNVKGRILLGLFRDGNTRNDFICIRLLRTNSVFGINGILVAFRLFCLPSRNDQNEINLDHAEYASLLSEVPNDDLAGNRPFWTIRLANFLTAKYKTTWPVVIVPRFDCLSRGLHFGVEEKKQSQENHVKKSQTAATRFDAFRCWGIRFWLWKLLDPRAVGLLVAEFSLVISIPVILWKWNIHDLSFAGEQGSPDRASVSCLHWVKPCRAHKRKQYHRIRSSKEKNWQKLEILKDIICI